MKVISLRLKHIILVGISFLSVICLLVAGLVYRHSVYANSKKHLPVYRVQLPEGDGRIAVTFDCAWGAQDISTILEILKEFDAKATFFVLGTWVEQYPDETVAILKAGHEIANHSYAHKAPTKLDCAGLAEEIQKCNDAIYAVTGRRAALYRAPSGEYNDFVVQTANSMGFPVIQWDVDSVDWKKEMTKEAIYERVITRTKAGSILLFHNDTNYTVEVLPAILKTLKEKGHYSVTVSELIYHEGYKIDANGEQQKIV